MPVKTKVHLEKYENYAKLHKIEKCTEGMSPADVYRCKLGTKTVYLKTIHNKYANTTYSVKREAEIMKWCSGKLNVPSVIEYGEVNGNEFLIMSEIEGQHIDEFINNSEMYVSYLAKAILDLQQIDISTCPFVSDINFRLKELDFLLENRLADVDISHWEHSTKFTEPQELYKWLVNSKPNEEYVFSHGDIGANMFVKNENIYFYDLARMGIADRWMDIALAVRDIRDECPDYEGLFFDKLGLVPNYEKINYYILLDEMF